MEKEQRETLQWFVDFANINLDELKLGDRAKLVVESDEYLFPKRELDALKEYSTLNDFIRLEKELDWAFGNRPPRDSPDYWSLIRRLHDGVKETLLDLATYHPPGKKVADATKFIPWKATSVQTVAAWGWDAEGKFKFFDIPPTGTQDDYIQMKLYRLFNNARRGTLQICPAPKCNKFFLNFFLREKRFCSPRCMWRFNAAERRKTNPKAYREYQKAVMKDKYRIEHDLKPKKFYKNKRRKEG